MRIRDKAKLRHVQGLRIPPLGINGIKLDAWDKWDEGLKVPRRIGDC